MAPDAGQGVCACHVPCAPAPLAELGASVQVGHARPDGGALGAHHSPAPHVVAGDGQMTARAPRLAQIRPQGLPDGTLQLALERVSTLLDAAAAHPAPSVQKSAPGLFPNYEALLTQVGKHISELSEQQRAQMTRAIEQAGVTLQRALGTAGDGEGSLVENALAQAGRELQQAAGYLPNPTAAWPAEDRAVDEERERLAAELLRQLEHLATANLTLALRADSPPELSFAALRGDFEALQAAARTLSKMELRLVPIGALVDAIGVCSTAQGFLKEMRGFDRAAFSDEGRAALHRGQLHTRAQAYLREAPRALAPAIAFGAAAQVARTPDRMRAELAELREQLEVAVNTANTRALRLTELAATAEDKFQKKAMADEARHFNDEAEVHEHSAKRWLLAMGGLGAVIVLLAAVNVVVLYRGAPAPGENAARVAQLLTAKVLLGSVLVAATVWCGRVYRALRHNVVVNRYRARALNSFDTLVQTTDDPAVRHAVLLQATQSIFAPQHSGFGSTEADPVLPGVGDLVRMTTAAKS